GISMLSFFFSSRRRHTRSKRDWSSDVCSSDLTSAKIDVVAVDKTGTLTEGRPELTDVLVLDPAMDRADVLALAAGGEAGSEHPRSEERRVGKECRGG